VAVAFLIISHFIVLPTVEHQRTIVLQSNNNNISTKLQCLQSIRSYCLPFASPWRLAMKSFVALALCLSLFNNFATARIPHSYRQLQEGDDESQSPNVVLSWLGRLFKRQEDEDVCYQDQYYDFVNNSTFGQNFCRTLGVQYPNRTVVEEFTPIV